MTAASQTESSAPKKKRQAPEGVPRLVSSPPFERLSSYVQRDVDAAQEMLWAHAAMVAVVMESGEDFSLYSNGVQLLHQLAMFRLDEALDSARSEIERMQAGRFLENPHDGELQDRIVSMVCAAYSASGVDMDYDNLSNWDIATCRLYSSAVAKYTRLLREKSGEDTHLLSVGSLLPWLEMRIWREIAGIDLNPALAGASSRTDQTESHAEAGETEFAASPVHVQRAEMAKRLVEEGLSISQISQILNVKRSAVVRILDRLHQAPAVRQSA